jgi:hypothetical protein
MMDTSATIQPAQPTCSKPGKACPAKWYTRLGAYAFLFFLVKGLAWLAAPAVLAYFATK